VIYRDFLKGIDETKFRSARLSVWFNTPEEYFQEQIKIYRVRTLFINMNSQLSQSKMQWRFTSNIKINMSQLIQS